MGVWRALMPTALARRPLLLIDVDGVLSLYGRTDLPALVDGVAHFLSRQAARTLDTLTRDFECVWCTGGEDRADTYLPHLLGLPRGWPHVVFDREPGPHWKLAGI